MSRHAHKKHDKGAKAILEELHQNQQSNAELKQDLVAQNTIIHVVNHPTADVKQSQHDKEENFVATEEDLASEISNNVIAMPFTVTQSALAQHVLPTDGAEMDQPPETLVKHNSFQEWPFQEWLAQGWMFTPAGALRMFEKNMSHIRASQLQMTALALEGWGNFFNKQN